MTEELKQSGEEQMEPGDVGATKGADVHTTGAPRGEKAGKISKYLRTENVPSLMKNDHLHIWEAQQIPNRANTKTAASKHIIAKISKFKDDKKIWKEENNDLLHTREPQ